MAVDGVVIDVPDTAKNRAEFGKKRHSKGGESPFPQVRIVGLGECGTHAVIAAAFDSWRVQERELFSRSLDCLEPGMLVLADRGFYSYDLWTTVRDIGVEMVWRIKDDIILPALEWLSDGSYRSELIPAELKADLKKGLRQSIPDELRVPVRVVEYMVTNRKEGERELIRLVTSIADHELAPAIELAALYQDRWEFELTLDEIETHQMPWSRVLRSKTPDLVRQEIWALLLAHYAVRHIMHEAADDLGEDPDRLSFIRSLRVIRRQVTNQAGFSPSPTRLRPPRNN
jgi:hypothetical protein